MIDIIKHGKYCEQKYIAKCNYCGCKFSYSENERHGYDCLHEKEYVTCPECQKWLLHKYSKIIKKEIK